MPDFGGMPERYEKALEMIALANGTTVIDEIVEAIKTVQHFELDNYGAISSSENLYGSYTGKRIWMDTPPRLVDLAMTHDLSAHAIMLRAIERHIQRVMVDGVVEFTLKLMKTGLTRQRELEPSA